MELGCWHISAGLSKTGWFGGNTPPFGLKSLKEFPKISFTLPVLLSMRDSGAPCQELCSSLLLSVHFRFTNFVMRWCKDKMSKICILEMLILLLFAISNANVIASTQDNDRFQCYPEDSVTEAKCIERGCVWKRKPAGAKKVQIYFLSSNVKPGIACCLCQLRMPQDQINTEYANGSIALLFDPIFPVHNPPFLYKNGVQNLRLHDSVDTD